MFFVSCRKMIDEVGRRRCLIARDKLLSAGGEIARGP